MMITTPQTPHRRRNPLTGEWVLVSAHRTERPWQGQEEVPAAEERPEYDPSCYLCPGNSRVGGVRNPDYMSTFVFTNDFPALLPDNRAESNAAELFNAETVPGTCRVVCFSPRHDLTLAEAPPDTVRTVIDLFADQVAELGVEYAWVQPFENRGAAMGASNPHPHGQIWAQSVVPGVPDREARSQSSYLATHDSHMLLDYAEREIADGARLVAHNDEWVSVVPYWAVWPFETLLVPRRHAGHLPDLDGPQRDGLADVLQSTLVKYDNLFRHPFPYSMGWHGRPFDGSDDGSFTLHAHLFPPLLRSATVRKFMVGYEMMAEAQRDITAEEAAARLQELPDLHYRHAAG